MCVLWWINGVWITFWKEKMHSLGSTLGLPETFFFTRFPVSSRLSLAARLADRCMNARKQLLPRVLSTQKKRELNLTKEKTRKEARTTRNLGWDFWPPVPMRGKAASHQRSCSWFVPVHSGHKQPTLYRWYCSLLWWPGMWKSVSARGPLTQLPERYVIFW